MSLTSDIKTLLTDISNVYIGSMPTSPDNSVCIYNTGGYTRDLSGTEVEEPTFQVRIRNTSYSTGETLCNTIKDILHGVNNSDNFLLIAQEGDILDIGRDGNDIQEWTLNFRAFYRR